MLLIYQQTSGLKLRLWQLLSFIPLAGLGLWLPDYGIYLMALVLFYLYGLPAFKDRQYLALFFSLYTVSFFSLIGNILDSLAALAPIYNILEFIIIPVPVLLNLVFLKVANPNFRLLHAAYELPVKAMLQVINSVLALLLVAEFSSYFLQALDRDFSALRYVISGIFFAVMALLLLYITMKIRLMQADQIKELRRAQLAQLTTYTQQIEGMYNEIHEVRHDLGNVLVSLQDSIANQDLPAITQIYNNVIAKYGEPLQNSKFNLTHLSNLKIPALKSLLSAKIISALGLNIATSVEIEAPVVDCYVELVDYLRILSIFLDNAIEANASVADPQLNIAFIAYDQPQQLVVIIDNTTDQTDLNINQIFKPKVSTKTGDHGLGLAIVKELLDRHPNLMLQTTCQDGRFRQVLTSTPLGGIPSL